MAECLDGEGDDFRHGFAGAHVTESAEAVLVPVLHRGEGVFEGATDGYDEVASVKTVSDEGAAHVACGAEDLEMKY